MTIIFAYTSKLPTRLYCSEIAQNKKAINTTQKGVFIAFLEKQGHSLTTNKPLYKNKRCFDFLQMLNNQVLESPKSSVPAILYMIKNLNAEGINLFLNPFFGDKSVKNLKKSV